MAHYLCLLSCRYEDNFDAVTNLTVITQKTDKSSISGYGSPEKFLNEFKYLLGTQVFTGERPAAACSVVHCGKCARTLATITRKNRISLSPFLGCGGSAWCCTSFCCSAWSQLH